MKIKCPYYECAANHHNLCWQEVNERCSISECDEGFFNVEISTSELLSELENRDIGCDKCKHLNHCNVIGPENCIWWNPFVDNFEPTMPKAEGK